jgi:hypothetical protein
MSRRFRRFRQHRFGSREVAAAVLALSATACVGIVGDAGEGHDDGKSLVLAAPALPRLTAVQYRSTLADLFGNAAPTAPLEDDTKPYLFYNVGASTTTLSELGVQLYEESADAMSRYVFSDVARRAAFVGCAPAAPGDECVQSFVKRFGRRVYRRPLTTDEVARWVNISTTLADPDAWEGLRLAVAGMLQSPHFLYRVDLGSTADATAARRKLTGYEMASRLSFLLWNQGPDEALLDAAERGELDTKEGVVSAAERLLDQPRARVAMQAFFRQYLDLGRLDGIKRDPAVYPLFAPGITDAMRKEVELLVEDLVFERRGDARSIFSTRMTFVNSDLAALYGVEAPGATKTEFVSVELPADGPRAGILTFGAFLTMNAHETQTSPTARGKYVRERVLCLEVPPPPPGVDTSLDPAMGGDPKTVRERMELHRTNPSCASCHLFMDPPGFLFEHFDSAGAYRTVQEGSLPIDSSGGLDGIELADARGLATVLETDERVGRCMVRQVYRHAQARLETEGEAAALEDLSDRFAGTSFDFRSLLIEVVSHDAFRFVGTEESP